jgi:phage tail tape-measure protein
MGRSLIGFCAMVGATAGGFVPELWGSSSFSFGSLVFGVLGGIAGVWFGVRLGDV